MGVQVTLKKGAMIVGVQNSDDFGDFKFDDLAENSGDYQLLMSVAGKDVKKLDVSRSNESSVGTIILE